ncbi:transcriptional regulator, AraC family [Carnobacterium sp. 17-4]|uniref:AraC family transcriptional regulator n=1 Tax=Carnobacterium sp. (strain 17-4) TaxID=208596 RepID=UPI0002058DFA|nr:AraC family transcriptional regulator [Carnobacterium sp. 17-4]AEB30773.1 transcriptional regulator, AraC family [Carnobacterium sp. 17-4]
MNREKEFSIPDICQLIHNIIQIDTEYFNVSHTKRKRLTNTYMPNFLEEYIEQSLFSIENILIQQEKNDVCYYKDETLQLHYLGKGMWQDHLYKGTIVIGPFISDSLNRNYLEQLTSQFSVSDDSLFNLKQYFEGIIILDQNRLQSISYLLTNLIPKKILQPNLISSDIGDLNLIQHSLAVNENTYSEVEKIYRIEKQILHAVEKGDRDEALRFLEFFKIDLTYRIPGNPLRTYKNLGFSLNTSLRITVEKVGISPIYIHLLSNKIAILIENLTTISELEKIQTVMISEYCQLVETDRSQKYSPVIKEAVTHIQLHYFEKISLSTISKKLNINATYLSKRFKIETGQTLTHYIQDLRINHSKELIKQNQLSITEVALKVGFENLNYFCTIFKKVTGVTPKHYFKL